MAHEFYNYLMFSLLLQQPNIDVNKGAIDPRDIFIDTTYVTPLKLAQPFKHSEIVELLQDAGAQ